MPTTRHRHIIETIYGRAGMKKFQNDMRIAQSVSKKFGVNISKDMTYAGTQVSKTFDKAGNIVTKKTLAMDKGAKRLKISWRETAGAAQALGVATAKATGGMSRMSSILGKAAKRALIVAPMWLLIRSAMMLMIRTVRDAIKAYIDLDDALARIRTVMHGTKEAIEREMIAIKSQIIETSADSRIAMKDLAEGFYFLKTANLSATEAMAAFKPTADLAAGTMNSMGQSARAVAGIYNTMGKYLGENLTVHQKFQKIADVLAYTYSTQDVQLSELIQSYTKLAPYISGLSDNFTELTVMLGFLNTRLLRGGRTGRLTGRAILQLTKNAKKLSGVLGITFDPDKPISFLDTIGKIRDMMGKVGKITAEQGQIIQEVFATRAGVVVRLLIEHFDDLSEQIKDAIENADGFAEKMKAIRMGTIAGQMARTKNVLAILAEEYLTAATGAKNMADSISYLNDKLIETRSIGSTLGRWTFQDLGKGIRIATYWALAAAEANEELLKGQIKYGEAYDRQTQLFGEMYSREGEQERISKKQRDEYLKREKNINKIIEKQLVLKNRISVILEKKDTSTKEKVEEIKLIEKSIMLLEKKKLPFLSAEAQLAYKNRQNKEGTNDLEEDLLNKENIRLENDKARLATMKLLGASTLDLAKAKLEMYEIGEKGYEKEFEILKFENKIYQEQVKYRELLSGKLLKTGNSLLKIMGASELQILDVQERQLRTKQKQFSSFTLQNRLLDIQLQKEIALQNQIKKREKLYLNVIEKFLKATNEEKKAMEEVITTLIPLEGKRIEHAFPDLSKSAKEIVFSMKSIFTPEQWKGVLNGLISELGRGSQEAIKGISRAIEKQPLEELDIKLMRTNELHIDRLRLGTEAEQVISKILGKLPPISTQSFEKKKEIPAWSPWSLPGERVPTNKAILKPSPQEIAIKPTFGDVNIEIQLPKDKLLQIPNIIGRKLIEELEKDPTLLTRISEVLRPGI